ncbi:class I SAM-dependent methyltransferase [Pseudanabaena sp. FACHB-2040]|uniref:class I SAM-dependent methyltransferase n=1 Tax=Pseudanabaena sp. FACHB-2040 TaxID=2692859 RepID=UPI00168793CA|nr:class I SAM-dependent methyltransferase [Pseudanabaena sp. FACHB-2040]MBD2260788.1 class I SAM-dependent methyltransferase [Pseudanabaena sp. FACHB-2040]
MSDRLLTWEEAVRWLKAQPDRQALVQHCYYDDPLQAAAERFSRSQEWQALAQLLKAHLPGEVLDLGAGRGISSYAFAKAGYSVTALEPDPSNLVGVGAIRSLIESSHLPIQIVQNYGEALPFEDGTFNVVYGRAVLHHAQALKQLCQESARVLKPGGMFIATREHVLSKKSDLQQFLDAHPLHFLYGGENAYLLSEYKTAIQAAGLKLRRTMGPLDNVINYSPMTRAEFQTEVATALSRHVGKYLGSWLANQQIVQQGYGRYRSLRSHTPGRLYSFLAVKP